jgi:DNA-binding beta-propeller fold protein YncE
MKSFLVALGLIGLVTLLCSVSFGADYIVTNDDNPKGNSATVFKVGPNGQLTMVKQLKTGGTGLGLGGIYPWTGVAISQNGECAFVANTGSDTISAFQSPSFKETGSYGIPGMFSANGYGGSIALNPNGGLLVSANSGLENIATWSVGSNCALQLLNQYTPLAGKDYFSPIAFTPNGAYVVVPAFSLETAELYRVGSSGSLTDLGYISFANISGCSFITCNPTGMDFTSDSKVVLFGNISVDNLPSVLSASITASGLSNAQFWDLTNGAGAYNVNTPHFTKRARSGRGILLLGSPGQDEGSTSGIICANFTENPLNISVVNSAVLYDKGQQGSVVTFGSAGWVPEPPYSPNGYSTIQSFSVSSNCGITFGGMTNDPNADNLRSIVGHPTNQ